MARRPAAGALKPRIACVTSAAETWQAHGPHQHADGKVSAEAMQNVADHLARRRGDDDNARAGKEAIACARDRTGPLGASSPPRACSIPRASSCCRYLPRVIGVVTSPTGAVIRDILHRLADRFPRPRAGLAGARAGRDLGGGGRRGDPRLQRAARPAARFRGPTCSSSRAAAARSRTSGASTRRSWCAPRPKAKSR